MIAEDVPARARRAGERFRSNLESLDEVQEVRGMGLLLAVQIDTDRVARTGAEVASALLAGDHGGRAVVNPISPTALRLAPSLLISDEEIDQGCDLIASALGAG
jgi:acetylornithine/succinyldiaminopimelate/putrescine aminotransferase